MAAGQTVPIVVMVTAQGRETLSERNAGDRALINGFLVKPVTTAMLVEAVVDARAAAVAAQRGENPAAPQAPVQRKRLQGMRILVVEDNKINQMVAKGLLSQEGADVTLADDGQLGVNAVAAAQPPFDVVLMDVQMPVMDGYLATRTIRQELGLTALPIVAMTANAMASDRAACLAVGMNDHVGKPFELDGLVALLQSLVGGGGGVEESAPVSAPDAAPTPAPHGMDLAAALERMGGDTRLFARAIHGFADDLGRVPAQVQALLAQGDAPAVWRSLHTLKGLAGTVGMVDVARGLAALEAQHKNLPPPGAAAAALPAALLAALQPLVDDTLRALEPVLQRYPRQESGPVVEPVALDAARLAADLHALCDLLQASDMAALAAHQQLCQVHAGALGAALAPLDAAMAALDFEKAVGLCRTLAKSYGLAG
jgi:CheY-like chemotaxis protein